MDAALGTTEEAAIAIEASMKKVTLHGDTPKLHGQATDSGGGGVLENLATELVNKELTVVEGDYLVGACDIHCLQLQLSNPVKECLGPGQIGKRNSMQLCASVSTSILVQGYQKMTGPCSELP